MVLMWRIDATLLQTPRTEKCGENREEKGKGKGRNSEGKVARRIKDKMSRERVNGKKGRRVWKAEKGQEWNIQEEGRGRGE